MEKQLLSTEMIDSWRLNGMILLFYTHLFRKREDTNVWPNFNSNVFRMGTGVIVENGEMVSLPES